VSLSNALRVLVGTAVVIGIVIFVSIGPWRGGHTTPVLHAVIEGPQLQLTMLDLKTGARTPVLQRLEYWFDSQRNLLRFKSSIDGQVKSEGLKQSNPNGQTSLSPALDTFVTGYRRALATGKAHETGTGTIKGRKVIWVTLPDGTSRQRVAIDANTYQPLVIQELDPSGKVEPLVWQVKTIELLPRLAADFTAPPATPNASAQISPSTPVSPTRAASVLGWTPVWLGTSFSGLKLGPIEPMHVTASHGIPVAEKEGLSISYSGVSPARITIQEAQRPGVINGFDSINPRPAAGHALLTTLSNGCRAQLQTHGVWVTVLGSNTNACRSVARTLVPIGAAIPLGTTIASSALLGVVATPAAGPAPRAALCAGAWNQRASARQRLSIASDHPLGAVVSGGGSTSSIDVFGSTSGGQTFNSANNSACSIMFFLAKGRIASAFGPWTKKTVPTWALLGPTQLHMPAAIAAGNASVASDGTVHLHG
jgi:hypothetical protein